MTVRAGLALINMGSPVAGLRPIRSFVAGLLTRLIFKRPGKAKTPGPFFPTLCLMSFSSSSNTVATCFRDRFVASASEAKIALLGAGLLFAMESSSIKLIGNGKTTIQVGKVESAHAVVNRIFPEKHGFFEQSSRKLPVFSRRDALGSVNGFSCMAISVAECFSQSRPGCHCSDTGERYTALTPGLGMLPIIAPGGAP